MLTFETLISELSRVGKTTAKRLKKIGLKTAKDLLFYYPFRHDDFSNILPISKLSYGAIATVRGRIELIKNSKSFLKRKKITEALVSDETGGIKAVWFNQPYLVKILKAGDWVYLSGKVDLDRFGLHFTSPSYEKIKPGQSTIHTARLVPIYSTTENLTQKQIRFLVKLIFPLAEQIEDWIPEEIRKETSLIDLKSAVKHIHFPPNRNALLKAKRRLKFDELFLLQLQAQRFKKELQKNKARQIIFFEKQTKKFVDNLPFKLTNAQKKAAWEILKDLGKERPMNRLLEGDVGSGKTVVAAIAILNTVLNGCQAVFMAPTEILAKQHYNTFCKLFADFNIKIGLITRSAKMMNLESDKLKKNKKNHGSRFIIHNSNLVIGTHALIQENVRFNNLGLAIVDEQHRFGVEQRAMLVAQTDTDVTRTNAEEKKNTQLLYEGLIYKIRGAVFAVKKQLGLGHKENIYQKALEEEFQKIGLIFKKEVPLNITYDNKKVGVYRPDFIIEEKIILEIKSLSFLEKFEKQQIWHYLKGSNYQLALLVNFGKEDVEIKRFIHISPCESALSPHRSVLMPHFLSMTATPIPRTMSLIFYGDLDLSVIDEMPVGRKKIITKVVAPENRLKAYDFIRKEIQSGRQIFVICPLIDPSDKLGVKSATEEYKKLSQEVFPDFKVGLLHGRLKAEKKEQVMNDFLANKINILVSTAVVEVGVDVPNATVMMIEGAERFGLATLHQFRGRVGRSKFQSYCFLFSESGGEEVLKRLAVLAHLEDGFKLAEKDLELRGPGEIYGTRQHGFPNLKMACLTDYKIIEEAKKQAENLIESDPELIAYPALKNKLNEFEGKVHLE